jgi:hypothetical protein
MKTKRSPNAIMAVLFKSVLIDAATCDAKMLELTAHTVALRFGDATDATFDELAIAVNLAAFRTACGDFLEAADKIAAAQNALHAIQARAHQIKKWGARGEELRALNEFIAVYIAMMGASTHLEMQRAARLAFPEHRNTHPATKSRRKAA